MSQIRCDHCSTRLDFEVLIPSDVWEQISHGRYALCPRCIDAECKSLGLKNVPCVAQYVGSSIATELDSTFRSAVNAWRPSQMQVDRDGLVGNPRLTREVFHGH